MLRTVVEQVPKTVIFCFNVPFLFTGLSSNMYKYTVSWEQPCVTALLSQHFISRHKSTCYQLEMLLKKNHHLNQTWVFALLLSSQHNNPTSFICLMQMTKALKFYFHLIINCYFQWKAVQQHSRSAMFIPTGVSQPAWQNKVFLNFLREVASPVCLKKACSLPYLFLLSLLVTLVLCIHCICRISDWLYWG